MLFLLHCSPYNRESSGEVSDQSDTIVAESGLGQDVFFYGLTTCLVNLIVEGFIEGWEC